MRRMKWSAVLGALVVVMVTACTGGGDAANQPGTDTTTVALPPAATAPPPGAATPGQPPQGATPEMVSQGQQVFSTTTCYTCHGADAKGTPLAPNLTDSEWLHGDGTYQSIIKTVTDGVPTPKNAPGPMLPKGGAPLTDEQIRAVSAYVWSLGGGK
jgi:mono/diheme cytochrome c family protein